MSVTGGGRPGLPGRQPDAAPARQIAVIGSGVAGLTAAYILSRTAEVTLLEADSRLGGHADTHQVTAGDGRELAVDTGFIVHNTRTYPLLPRLFTELGVSTQPSEMSMSVSCSGCGLEYAGQRGLGGLLAGRRPRLIRRSRPAHYGARSLNFCSLPVAVLGSASRDSTEVGHLRCDSRGVRADDGNPLAMPHAEASIATATSRSFWPPDSDFGADIPSGKHDSREAPVPGRFPSG